MYQFEKADKDMFHITITKCFDTDSALVQLEKETLTRVNVNNTSLIHEEDGKDI